MELQEISLPTSDNGVLFILGNGFDLDLKFETSYESFFKKAFPFVKNDCECHMLGRYLYEKKILEKWFDLEDFLADYGKEYGPQLNEAEIEEDKKDYYKLVHSLAKYLQRQKYTEPDKNSVAARLLIAADDPLVKPRVYTFNYTPFDIISESLGVSFTEATHVHGSLKGNNIILGVGEYIKLEKTVSYLHKTSSINYHSTDILEAFERFDTIIIFGLSLSKVDYPYFEDFFKKLSLNYFGEEHKKYIRVFTYNEESRIQILDSMRDMNNGLIKLFNYSDFDIIRTNNGEDEEKVQAVIQRLSKRYKIHMSSPLEC